MYNEKIFRKNVQEFATIQQYQNQSKIRKIFVIIFLVSIKCHRLKKPTPNTEPAEAINAASPPDEPPGIRDLSYGLFVRPLR